MMTFAAGRQKIYFANNVKVKNRKYLKIWGLNLGFDSQQKKEEMWKQQKRNFIQFSLHKTFT